MKKIMKKILPIAFMLVFAATMAQASEITGTLSTGGVSPATPTGLTTSNPSHGDTGITINWNSVAFVGGYNLYRIKNGDTAVFVASTTNTTYADTGLSDGNYSYQVESYLGTLVSEKSAPTAPVTVDTTVTAPSPSAPAPTGGGGGGGGYTPPPTYAPADFDNNGKVDILDFNILMNNWGTTTAADKTAGDANGDHNVDILDFNLLIINWQS